ncbi:MAG: LolA family protein [Desulfosporosinus sp.]
MNQNKNTSQKPPEQELDDFINALNLEQQPKASSDQAVAELQCLTRKIKNLRPIPDPNEKFTRELQRKLQTRTKPKKRFLPWSGFVASIFVLFFLISSWSHTDKDIVLAMEQTVSHLQNYHGILKKVSTNAAGESQITQRVEIWSEGNNYATRNEEGIMTVNNGELCWINKPKSKEITLLPLYLDPHDFDLQKEATRAQLYPHKIMGEDTIAGRRATRLEITPPGGLAYNLWIDTETHLPIQLQTAMQKSLQTTYTFVSLETNIQLPDSIFHYNPPAEYRIIDQNPDKPVTSLAEAIAVSGLNPVVPTEKPQRYFASPNRIVFDFEDTIVIESKTTTPFVVSPLAALGQAEGSALEVLPDSLRWQHNELEITVQGERTEELAKQLSNTIVIPQVGQTFPKQPSVKVEIDMEVVKNNQQQVDAGSSPWQLDPAQVAYTFAILQISPEGIQGEPPLNYNSLKVTLNTGTDAIIDISQGPIKKVYVKRLIRQDQSGIWTVIGYDPR